MNRETDKGNSAQCLLVGKLIEMGDMRDSNGDPVRGVLIECSGEDLRDCDLRMYGQVGIYNAPDDQSSGIDIGQAGGFKSWSDKFHDECRRRGVDLYEGEANDKDMP